MAIPKIIHYCWFGGVPKPESVCRCIDSWKKYCPDYEIREWSEKNFDVSQNIYCKQAYDAHIWGFVPDYIRLWIIYHYGGIYLDTDVQLVKSFDTLLANPAFCGFEKETGNKVNFGQGFGAVAGNKIIGEHMHLYDDMHFLCDDGSYNKKPSPEYTTAVLLKHGLDQCCKQVQCLDDITVYPEDYFCPKSYISGLIKLTPNTFSIHHFDSSWYTAEQQKDKKKRWKKEKHRYILHFPCRVIQKILGMERYLKIRSYFKK